MKALLIFGSAELLPHWATSWMARNVAEREKNTGVYIINIVFFPVLNSLGTATSTLCTLVLYVPGYLVGNERSRGCGMEFWIV
jgi:quinol-cytochrome oxidoreductase complex cytochrome b subunit